MLLPAVSSMQVARRFLVPPSTRTIPTRSWPTPETEQLAFAARVPVQFSKSVAL